MRPFLKLVTDPPAGSASAPDFAEAMSALASGVVVVTCLVGGQPWGMTVTAFASVSADPPTVLVSLGSETMSARAIAGTRRFGVSILAADQVAVASFGSQTGAAKLIEPFTEGGDEPGACPALAGALAHLDCEVSDAVRAADHTVFFGRVRAVRASGTGGPLVHHRRAYRTLAGRVLNSHRLEGISDVY
jgi:flavin reductase (DIM6/NTAB) family NADH-FMN oxidoreductase RutF